MAGDSPRLRPDPPRPSGPRAPDLRGKPGAAPRRAEGAGPPEAPPEKFRPAGGFRNFPKFPEIFRNLGRAVSAPSTPEREPSDGLSSSRRLQRPAGAPTGGPRAAQLQRIETRSSDQSYSLINVLINALIDLINALINALIDLINALSNALIDLTTRQQAKR